jgi:UDP-N-acetylmuramoyl-tripeptide--D-alanyl-D-alanine ligase
MKQTLQKLLAFLARKIIRKYHPVIVGITGSVGKTSAKEAIFQVVSQKYKSYRPVKNFNNEIGLPLAIIGSDSPGRSIFGWVKVLLRAKALWLLPLSFPEVLVLEYGVDRPGDMDYLLHIAKPHVSVITGIGFSHYEFFSSVEAIEKEKGKLAEALSEKDILVINADNAGAAKQSSKTNAHVYKYGFGESSNVLAQIEKEEYTGRVETVFSVKAEQGEKMEFTLHAVGKPHIYAGLAAASVGLALGIEPSLIRQGLAMYKPLPGRLNVIGGIKHSIVIDDTYNAAPDSMREAIELLVRTPANMRVAVLGDMLELGSVSDEKHNEIGKLVASHAIHRLVTVGAQGRRIAEAAIAAGFPESKVSSWDNSEVAKQVVQQIIEPESVILVKGSQGVRMEKISKEIMAEPMRADELLCRQYGKWLLN